MNDLTVWGWAAVLGNLGIAAGYIVLGSFLLRGVVTLLVAAAERAGITAYRPRPVLHAALFVFFVGCAYMHAEIAWHVAFDRSMPDDFSRAHHVIPMLLQGFGAWTFIGAVAAINVRLSP